MNTLRNFVIITGIVAVSLYVFVEAGVPITSCIMGHDHFEAISLLRRNNIINVGTTNNVYYTQDCMHIALITAYLINYCSNLKYNIHN